MHRDQVKARTRRAQLTAGALAALAVAVVGVPASMMGGGSSADEPAPAASAPASSTPATAAVKPAGEPVQVADPSGLALALDKLGQAPVIPPKVAPPPTAVAETAPPPAPAPAPWRYIGVIVGQTRLGSRAIVSVNERQAMVREGDKVDQDRVDEIHDTFLMVTGADNVQRRVDMEIAQRPTLTVTTPAPTAVASAAGGHAGEGELSPEEWLARASEQGIDEETLEKMKEAMNQGVDPRAFMDPSSARAGHMTARQQAQMVAVGGGKTGRGRGGPELDVFTRLHRERLQRLDDAFRSGEINADQYKDRKREIENVPGSKDGEGDADAAQRELNALQSGEVNSLGQPTGATNQPKPK